MIWQCVSVLTAYRPRSTNCANRSRFSKRSSAVQSWRCVACRRLVHVSSVRSKAKLPRSTSTATSVSSCVAVRCWTRVQVPSTTCASRLRPEPMTSIANPRSRSSSVQPVRKAWPRSPESHAASRSSSLIYLLFSQLRLVYNFCYLFNYIRVWQQNTFLSLAGLAPITGTPLERPPTEIPRMLPLEKMWELPLTCTPPDTYRPTTHDAGIYWKLVRTHPIGATHDPIWLLEVINPFT